MSDNQENLPKQESSSGNKKDAELKRPQIIDPQPSLSESQQQAAAMLQARIQFIASSFSGPLPSPQILAAYDQIVPGTAARIIAMAETQAQHRQNLESTVIGGDVRRSWYGLWTGFVIGMAGIV